MRLKSSLSSRVLRASVIVLPSACSVFVGPLGCSSNADDGAVRRPANAAGSTSTDATPKTSRDGGGTLGAPLTEADIACSKNADCGLVLADCCANLNHPAADFVALRSDRSDAYKIPIARYCATRPCVAIDVQSDPAIIAACVEGSCAVVNLREAASVTACGSDADCTLRSLACCACGDVKGGQLIGISSEAAYEALACSDSCDPCDVTLDIGSRAYCNNGTCAVALAP